MKLEDETQWRTVVRTPKQKRAWAACEARVVLKNPDLVSGPLCQFNVKRILERRIYHLCFPWLAVDSGTFP